MPLWTNVDEANGKPKYLTTGEKAITYGVDEGEMQVTATQNKGFVHAGWNMYTTYTDGNGNTRHKAETLVAMGTITGDGADDSLLADRTITITSQPGDQTKTAGQTATFSVVASVSPAAALTYQWQVSADSGATWTNINGATSSTYTFTTVIGDNGKQYRAVVSAPQAANVTSDAADLTVS